MKERPILFKGELVKAILEGRKTQTRRVLKQREPMTGGGFKIYHAGEGDYFYERGDIQWALFKCPFGQVGDRLWIRETWAPMCRDADPICWCDHENERPFLYHERHYVEYRAETRNKRPGDWPEPEDGNFEDVPRWRPSLHMPRWASRLTLEITGVRVERLQEISEEDAAADGGYSRIKRDCKIPKFKSLWDSLAKPGTDWASNPWVWVIEFKRVEK